MVGLLGCGCCSAAGCEGGTPTITDNFQPPDMTIWESEGITDSGRLLLPHTNQLEFSGVTTYEDNIDQPFRFGFSRLNGGIDWKMSWALGPTATHLQNVIVPPPTVVGYRHYAAVWLVGTLYFDFWNKQPPFQGSTTWYDSVFQFRATKNVYRRSWGIETKYVYSLAGQFWDFFAGRQFELEYESLELPNCLPVTLDIHYRYPADQISADRRYMYEIKQARCPAIANGEWVNLREPGNIPRSNRQGTGYDEEFIYCGVNMDLEGGVDGNVSYQFPGMAPINWLGAYWQFNPLTWTKLPTL